VEGSFTLPSGVDRTTKTEPCPTAQWTKQKYDLISKGFKVKLQNRDIAITKLKAGNAQLEKELE